MRKNFFYVAWAIIFLGLIVLGVLTFTNNKNQTRQDVPQTPEEWWELAEKGPDLDLDEICLHFPKVDLPEGFPEDLDYPYAGDPVAGALSTDVKTGIVRIDLEEELNPPALVKPMGWEKSNYLEFNYQDALFYFPGASLVDGEVTVWMAANVDSVDYVILLPSGTVISGMAGVALFPVPCFFGDYEE